MGDRWSTAWTLSRAWDWVGYDRLAIANDAIPPASVVTAPEPMHSRSAATESASGVSHRAPVSAASLPGSATSQGTSTGRKRAGSTVDRAAAGVPAR